MERDSRDVACVAFKRHDRIRVGGLDIEKLYIVVASSSKESLIRSDAQAIDLRVGVLNGSRTDTRKCFPEAEQRKQLVVSLQSYSVQQGL